ncbi:hypothetical protein [Lysobacter antibioticus]|uniref:Uncharacterized protein n=1 Tax=Lysobacter antibioticus TaxID=84531 RepID=A0A0S2FHW2_LYSAN|nr:hypothetical protein [Lysobacter antibioticus]ALN83132.1 hypothetical protein LA76x_5030 [Lysobacter antibioticus]
MNDLTPAERAAFFVLLKRQPLFKWEREVLTELVLASLEKKGLIIRGGQEWRVTEHGRRRAESARKP